MKEFFNWLIKDGKGYIPAFIISLTVLIYAFSTIGSTYINNGFWITLIALMIPTAGNVGLFLHMKWTYEQRNIK